MGLDVTKNTTSSYTLLSGLFNLGLALFCWRKKPEQITLKDWGLLTLATFRMSRLIAYDTVMQPYRAPVVEVVPHDSGAGETTQAKPGRGIKRAIGEMIACPICNGTWISAGLVYGLCLAPNYTRTLITVMSAVGAAEVLQGAFEALQWNGELARHRTGEQMRVNRTQQQADAAANHAESGAQWYFEPGQDLAGDPTDPSSGWHTPVRP
jgi:hypothetical protein